MGSKGLSNASRRPAGLGRLNARIPGMGSPTVGAALAWRFVRRLPHHVALGSPHHVALGSLGSGTVVSIRVPSSAYACRTMRMLVTWRYWTLCVPPGVVIVP